MGASSPSDCGDYFAWGETKTKSEYTDANSKNHRKNIRRKTGSIAGEKSYDAARAKWGGTWRMPNVDEFRSLIEECTWTWASMNSHEGYLVTGPNGNSIFLPITGIRSDGNENLRSDEGQYWSGLIKDKYGWETDILVFDRDSYKISWTYRSFGIPIRPVTE